MPTPTLPRWLGALYLGALLLAPAAAQTQRDLSVVALRLPGQGQAQRLYGDSHALVIGASQYQSGWSQLPGVPGDTAAVRSLLQAQGFKVQTLPNPTRQQLDDALRQFANSQGLSPANRLLVYFAGHGHTLTTGLGKRLGYIVPVDAPRPDLDPTGFRRLAYSMENFELLSRQIEAKHVLFVFDSCFSGTVFRSRSGVPDSISDKTDKPVRLFITAGDADQPVPDESVFRRQFERALGADAEADLNGDGFITGTELGSFLEDRVTNYSRRSQTPRWGKLNDPDLDRGDYVFLNPRRPAGTHASVQPEPVPRAPLPGQADGVSLDDLRQEQQAREAWSGWQARMQADYEQALGFRGAPDLQVKAWERFLATWTKDNPYSAEAKNLRAQAQQRLDALRREAQPQTQAAPARTNPSGGLEKVTFAGDVHYPLSDARIPDDARVKLMDLAQKIQSISIEVVIVTGHTDPREVKPAEAVALGMRRAEGVKAFLVSLGVERNRVYTESKGAQVPVADNAMPEGRAKNRRVEVEAVGTRKAS